MINDKIIFSISHEIIFSTKYEVSFSKLKLRFKAMMMILVIINLLSYLLTISNGATWMNTILLPPKRPFYLIGHMANSIDEIDDYLNRGANAIEADVQFDSNGSMIKTYHGPPCDDCSKHCDNQENIIPYLIHLNKLSKPD